MRKLLFFSYLIVFCFGIIGILFFSTVVHEYSHMKDYRNLNIDLQNESIIINIPLEWKNAIWETQGVYSVYTKVKNHDQVVKGTKYTEIKAYFISIVLILIFYVCFMYITYKMEGYRTFRYFEEQRV